MHSRAYVSAFTALVVCIWPYHTIAAVPSNQTGTVEVSDHPDYFGPLVVTSSESGSLELAAGGTTEAELFITPFPEDGPFKGVQGTAFVQADNLFVPGAAAAFYEYEFTLPGGADIELLGFSGGVRQAFTTASFLLERNGATVFEFDEFFFPPLSRPGALAPGDYKLTVTASATADAMSPRGFYAVQADFVLWFAPVPEPHSCALAVLVCLPILRRARKNRVFKTARS